MKIICKQEKLIKALNIVSKAISAASTVGITRGILIKAEGDLKISLSATDLHVSIMTQLDAVVNETGGVVVSAKLFMDLVRRLPAGDILISTDDKNIVTVKTEFSDYEMQGIEESEFPRIDSEEEGKAFEFDKEVFRELIEGTCFAASADESRGIITGELLEIEGGVMAMVALDGYRVAVRREYSEQLAGENLHVVIPAKMLREAGKILAEAADEGETTDFLAGEKKAVLKTGETTVKMNLMAGEYIKYKDVIPVENKIKVTVDRFSLQSAVERAAMFRSDGKNAFVRFSLTPGILTVSSRADEGRGRETIPIDKEGDDIEIGFDARFVNEALKSIVDERIVMEFSTSVSPCLIRPEEGDRYTYLILPVRLSTVNI